MMEERQAIDALDAQLDGGDHEKFRKGGKYQAYQRRQGKK
jgi:hypothetical protein